MKERLLNIFIVGLLVAVLTGIAIFIWPERKNKNTAAVPIDVSDLESTFSRPQGQKVDVREVLKKPLETAQLKGLKQPKDIEQLKETDDRTSGLRRRGPFPPGLQEGHVFFEVIEGGFAVAFGDVILGKLPPDRKDVQSGAFEPPRPKLWPSPEIPFKIEQGVDPQPVLQAIEHFETQTPIRFVELQPDDPNGIVFLPTSEHCASQLGMAGGIQPILLSKDCGVGQVIHEIMHALGFVHEHSREERDKYLDIKWDNIQEPFLSQFNIVPDKLVHNYVGSVFSFDFNSIMLYPETAFAKGKDLKTLVSKTGEPIRPANNQLSKIDKERVYYLYGY